jgi:predicted nucleic acid-binding protein
VNVVDSCGWLEYLSDGPNAECFVSPLADTESLLVPTICIYEVTKVVLRERGESHALAVMAIMQKGRVVDLGGPLAVAAARLSLAHSLPMADSIVLATARQHDATLWTQDVDFADIPGVQYFRKS